MKRWISAAMLALLAPALVHANGGVNYPDKPIRIVVPYLAGGAADVLARRIGEKLADRLRQPVVVDNKPGLLR